MAEDKKERMSAYKWRAAEKAKVLELFIFRFNVFFAAACVFQPLIELQKIVFFSNILSVIF